MPETPRPTFAATFFVDGIGDTITVRAADRAAAEARVRNHLAAEGLEIESLELVPV